MDNRDNNWSNKETIQYLLSHHSKNHNPSQNPKTNWLDGWSFHVYRVRGCHRRCKPIHKIYSSPRIKWRWTARMHLCIFGIKGKEKISNICNWYHGWWIGQNLCAKCPNLGQLSIGGFHDTVSLDAHYTKTTRPDPSSEGKTYSDHTLQKSTIYCCDQFKDYCKKFPSWSYQSGRFTIIDSITYDSNTQTPINYCPFCGQKIKYKQVKS